MVLTVGTDCNVGKMTAQLQLTRELNERGVRTRFVATGQTGIMIEGWGIAVDAVVADFIAGAAERLVLEGSRDADIVLVEGQGSINHPGYSAVTLGLLHGSCPDALDPLPPDQPGVHRRLPRGGLAPDPSARRVRPALREIGSRGPSHQGHRDLAQYLRSERGAEARRAVRGSATQETGLPATDPVRFDPAPLVDAIETAPSRPRRPEAALAEWYRRRKWRFRSAAVAAVHAACSPALPLPLLDSPTSLASVLPLSRSRESSMGAWVRGIGRRLACGRGRAGGAMLMLCRRSRTAPSPVRPDCGPPRRRAGRAPAERLIASAGAPRSSLGLPYLPAAEQLQALISGRSMHGGVLDVPIGADAPEEVLAACARGRIPVAASRIRYRAER